MKTFSGRGTGRRGWGYAVVGVLWAWGWLAAGSAQAKDRILQGSTVQIYTGPLGSKAEGPLPPDLAAFWKPLEITVKGAAGRALTDVQIERLDLEKPVVYTPPPAPTSFWDNFTINKDPVQFRDRVVTLLATAPVGNADLFGDWAAAEAQPNTSVYERNLAARRAAAPDAPLIAYDPTLAGKSGEIILAGQQVPAFKSADGVRAEIARRLGADAEADLAAHKDPFKERHVYLVAWLAGRAAAGNPAPPVTVSTPSPGGPAARTLLRFSGSNTIGSKLLPALAAAFLKQEGCVNVHAMPGAKEEESFIVGDQNGTPVQIQIHAHGSATAFEDLQAGRCDLGMASRKVKPAERDALLSALGDITSNAGEHVLALDGIAVIVNPTNPLKVLSVEQLAGLFSGGVGDWSQVGGRPGPVNVYARDNKSGTWDFFNDAVLKARGKTLKPGASRFEDSTKLSDAVAADSGGIGFIGLNYVGANKLLAVSDQGVAARKPTLLTIKTLDYLLSRQLYLYTSTNPTNPNVNKFVEYALGGSAQPVVDTVGLVNLDLNPITKPGEIDASDPRLSSAEWRRLTAGATEIPTRYRFRVGSPELDPKGYRDIGRIVGVLSQPKYQGKRVILIGFADASGSADANRELSRKRANIVKGELAPEGLDVNEVDGLGAQAFVAPNDTVENKEKNRRVEVWLK